MSAAYRQLLDATIAHLEHLDAQGVRSVPVLPATLAALTKRSAPVAAVPARAIAPVSSPASPRPVAPAPTPGAERRPVSPRSAEPESFAAAFEGDAADFAARPAVVPIPTVNPLADKPLPPRLDPASKVLAFAALQQRVLACQQCSHLVAARHSVVFGVGDPDARILFIGEAPGADEDLAGEPFVGRAGELLTKIIGAMGLGRESVYIANILKCRPDMPGGAPGNRKPRPDEMATCNPWLHEQIDLIQPEVLVALGSTAVEGLLGGTVGITRLRGKWQSYRGIPLMPTYHPAYLLRNQVISEKRKVWEDMLEVMEKIGLPISARQRGYFLNP